MPRVVLFGLLLLAGVVIDGGRVAVASVNVEGWRFASGKPPSHAEYSAIVATCEDGAVSRPEGQPLDACLADLGLRPAP